MLDLVVDESKEKPGVGRNGAVYIDVHVHVNPSSRPVNGFAK
jgi:hypothetical protein